MIHRFIIIYWDSGLDSDSGVVRAFWVEVNISVILCGLVTHLRSRVSIRSVEYFVLHLQQPGQQRVVDKALVDRHRSSAQFEVIEIVSSSGNLSLTFGSSGGVTFIFINCNFINCLIIIRMNWFWNKRLLINCRDRIFIINLNLFQNFLLI